MVDWKQRLKRWLVPEPPTTTANGQVASGLYPYQRLRDGEYIRFHLRVEPDGSAILLVAAAEAVRLSPTGARIAKALLDGMPREEVQARIGGAYAGHLVGVVVQLLDTIGRPSSRYPVFNLADPLAGGPAAQLLAPLQADVVLGNDAAVLGTGAAVQPLVRRLWDAGIPHVRFLADPTLATRTALDAVVAAEDIGMIAGIRAAARWWSEDQRVRQLSQAGLDYVVLPWVPSPAAHVAVFGVDDERCLPEIVLDVRSWEMTPVLEVPLLADTLDQLEAHRAQLTQWDVAHLEVFALATENPAAFAAANATAEESAAEFLPLPAAALRQLAAWSEELADAEPLQVIWLPPHQVSSREAILDYIKWGPRASGDLAIRIEANGDVVPPRGPATSAGNLLHDAWDTIWNHPVFTRYRNRVEAVTRCDVCPGLAICAADCPADERGWVILAPRESPQAADPSI